MFMSQEKLQTMSMQNFGGVKEVHYGIVQVVNLLERKGMWAGRQKKVGVVGMQRCTAIPNSVIFAKGDLAVAFWQVFEEFLGRDKTPRQTCYGLFLSQVRTWQFFISELFCSIFIHIWPSS